MPPWALLLFCVPISGVWGSLHLGTAPREVAEPCGPLGVPSEVALDGMGALAKAGGQDPSFLDSCQHQEKQAASLEQPQELWGSGWRWLELEEAPVAHRLCQVARLLEDIAEKMETLLAAQQNHTVRCYEEALGKLWRMNRSLGRALSLAGSARNHPQRTGTAGLDGSTARVPHGAGLLLLALLPAVLLLLAAFPALLGPYSLAPSSARGVLVPPGAGEPRCHLTSTPKRGCELQLLQDELDGLELSCLQGDVRCLAELSCLEQSPPVAGDPRSAGAVTPVPSSHRTKPSSAASPGRPVTRRSLRGVTSEMGPGTGHLREAKSCRPSQCPATNMSLLSPRLLCQGVTKAGQRCRKWAVPGQVFCRVHGCRRTLSPQP